MTATEKLNNEYLPLMESMGFSREEALLRLAEPRFGETDLHEAAIMHGDVKSRLSKAVSDLHPSQYADYVDHDGDGTSGNVVYRVSGGGVNETRSAPYSSTRADGKLTTVVDTKKAKPVTAETAYRPTEAERLRESTSLAHSFGLRGKAAERIMAEGRSGFDPFYNSADHQPVTEPVETVETHEVSRLASQFGLRSQQARDILERGPEAFDPSYNAGDAA